jgi:hypothetical protein
MRGLAFGPFRIAFRTMLNAIHTGLMRFEVPMYGSFTASQEIAS